MEDIIYDADSEPVIEELIESEEEYEDMKNSINPNIVKLKKGFVLKRCLDCGYERQMFPHEKQCRLIKCRSTNLEVIDVDKRNKEIDEEAESMRESLKRDYEAFYKPNKSDGLEDL